MSFPAILIPNHLEVALVRGNSGLANKTKQIVDLNGGHIQSHHQMNGAGGIAKINDLGLMTLIGSSQGLILKGTTTQTIDAHKQKNTMSNGADGGGAMRLDTALIKALGANIGSAMPLIAAIKEMQARGEFFITPAQPTLSTTQTLELGNHQPLSNMARIFEILAEIINLNAVTPLPAAMESHQQSIVALMSELVEIMQAEIPQMNETIQTLVMASIHSIAPIVENLNNVELAQTLNAILDSVINSSTANEAKPELKLDTPIEIAEFSTLEIAQPNNNSDAKNDEHKIYENREIVEIEAGSDTEAKVESKITDEIDDKSPVQEIDQTSTLIDDLSQPNPTTKTLDADMSIEIPQKNPAVIDINSALNITPAPPTTIKSDGFFMPPVEATHVLRANSSAPLPPIRSDVKPIMGTKFMLDMAASFVAPVSIKSSIQNPAPVNIVNIVLQKISQYQPILQSINNLSTAAKINSAPTILPQPILRSLNISQNVSPILSKPIATMKPQITATLTAQAINPPITIATKPINQNAIPHIPKTQTAIVQIAKLPTPTVSLPQTPRPVNPPAPAAPVKTPVNTTATAPVPTPVKIVVLPQPIIEKFVAPILKPVSDNFVKANQIISTILKPPAPPTPNSAPEKIQLFRETVVDIFKQPPERIKENIITTVQDFYKRVTTNPHVMQACPKGGAVCNCFNKVSTLLKDNNFLKALADNNISAETFKKDIDDQRKLNDQLTSIIIKSDPRPNDRDLLLDALKKAKPATNPTPYRADLKGNFEHVCGPDCNHGSDSSPLTRAVTSPQNTEGNRPLTAKEKRAILAAVQNKTPSVT